MNNLIWFLLPVAAASGWFIAWQGFRRDAGQDHRYRLSPDYFKGLNYLLNEQPDKAIEVFIKLLEIDRETIETHYALGNLYRRRGEVDRAIRIHQNLVSRPELDERERSLALLELGYDYMKAGLFDRAESLFNELVESGVQVVPAYQELLDIYQQENDWSKAIDTAHKLEKEAGVGLGKQVAQYYCEMAEAHISAEEHDSAYAAISEAETADPACVRASLIHGQLCLKTGQLKDAIKAYKRVEMQDADYLPEVIGPLLSCYREHGNMDELMSYLRGLIKLHGGITPMLVLAELINEREGEEECVSFITQQLRSRPSVRGLDRLIELTLDHAEGDAHDSLSILKDMTSRLLEGRAIYKCHHCGFTGRSLHWQCPGCKHWNSLKPIQGIEGE